jgi:hypothetical protein
MALRLVPRTAQARAHRHPIGVARAALAPSAPPSPAAGDFGLRPQDLHSAYALPTSASGTQTIALVDAYNDVDAESDLAIYSKEFALPECTAADGCFEKVNQNGESANLPFPQTRAILTKDEQACHATKENRRKREEACLLVEEAKGWSVEISLDIETAHGVCQSCHIALVEADEPSYEDLETAEDSAARLGADEISNSWGGPECDDGSCLEDSSAFDHPGVVIAAAAGDYGYLNWLEESPSPYASFPAVSPQVVAVGGTRLNTGAGGEWTGESVWNDGGESDGVTDGAGAGGGGCSTRFDAQPWQQGVSDWSSVGCGVKRAAVDVAADADPYTGVAVYDSASGAECESEYEEDHTIHVLDWCTYGGTSLATPLIAATFALAGGAGGVEYPARTLYENETSSLGSLHDVTEGSNGACRSPFDEDTGLSSCTAAEEAAASCASEAICLARTGYDGPTGVGTPDGIAAFTPPPRAPSGTRPVIESEAASHITQNDATLEARIDPGGLETEYEVLMDDPCPAPLECIRAAVLVAKARLSPTTTEEPVSVDLADAGADLNIEPDMTYTYWVRAKNSDGSTEGAPQTFTTELTTPPPPPPQQQQLPGEAGTSPPQGSSTMPAQGVSASQEREQPAVPDAELASTSLLESSSGTLSVRVSCPAAETSCSGTVTLRTLNAVSVGASGHQANRSKAAILTLTAGSFDVAGGRVTTLRLRLHPKARALLVHARTLRARATIAARDPAGASHTAQVNVTIRAYRATGSHRA